MQLTFFGLGNFPGVVCQRDDAGDSLSDLPCVHSGTLSSKPRALYVHNELVEISSDRIHSPSKLGSTKCKVAKHNSTFDFNHR